MHVSMCVKGGVSIGSWTGAVGSRVHTPKRQHLGGEGIQLLDRPATVVIHIVYTCIFSTNRLSS